VAAVLAWLAVLALAACCTVRVRPEPAPTSRAARGAAAATTTTAGPSARGTTVASRAFVLVRGMAEIRVRPAPPGPLPLAMRGADDRWDEVVNLVLVFPLLRAPARCLREAELWLRLLRFEHQAPTLAAYPSPS
jgi:hypothetical protein